MIHVCDAIMGSGKTSAAINYMNGNPDGKYIFITPYLDEAERIKRSCKKLKFESPSTKSVARNHTKSADLIRLLEKGKNIATTHSLFSRMSADTLRMISDNGYTLFIDESLGVLCLEDFNQYDISLAENAGFLERDANGVYRRTDKKYPGVAFVDMLKEFEMHDISSDDNGGDKIRYYYWLLPPEFIESFKEVFVLTYLFESSDMRMMLEMNHIEYDKVFIRRENDEYTFNYQSGTLPEYTAMLDTKIHLIGSGFMNRFGDDKNAMTLAWYSKADSPDEVRKHMAYLYTHLMKDCTDNPKLMWGTYKSQFESVSGPGYKTKYVVFNERATNKYADRNVLAYLVNIFPNKVLRSFCDINELELDWDSYALSTMVQWIWRSAIRKGEEVWLYLPSKRMRDILTNWIADVMRQYKEQNGGEENAAS